MKSRREFSVFPSGERKSSSERRNAEGRTAAKWRLRCFHAKDLHGLRDDGAGVGLAVDAHDEGLVQQDVGVFCQGKEEDEEEV